MAKRSNRISLAGRPFMQETEEDVISVVLAQPHRRGNRDQKCASAWGRFILRNKLSQSVYDAGEKYRATVERHRMIKGVPSMTRCDTGSGSGDPDKETVAKLTKQMYAMKAAMIEHSALALGLIDRMTLDDEDFGDTLDSHAVAAARSLASHLGFLPPLAPFYSAAMAA